MRTTDRNFKLARMMVQRFPRFMKRLMNGMESLDIIDGRISRHFGYNTRVAYFTGTCKPFPIKQHDIDWAREYHCEEAAKHLIERTGSHLRQRRLE